MATTTPTQPMDHPLGLSLNTWVSQHRATGHDVRYTMLSARCEDCGDWGPSKWAVDDDEYDDPQDTTTRGRHREPTTRPAWLLSALGALAVVVLLVVLAACSGSTTTTAVADEPDRTPLEQVQSTCVVPASAIGDGGRTLVVDHKGEDDTTGVTIETVACVLAALDTPTSITARMDSTRALDGVQSGSWDGYSAVWSYHPDSGMDLIIEED